MASYQFICPSTYIHDGKKVPRNSLTDTIKYGIGTEDVWVFEPEFLVEQILVYRGMAEHNMDDAATADAVAERVRMNQQLYGISWYKSHAPNAAVEATEKACAAAAEVYAATNADDIVWKAAADEYDHLGFIAVYLFENLVYMQRTESVVNKD